MTHPPQFENYQAYYDHNLVESFEFQDYVVEIMFTHFYIPIVAYNSRKYQLKGESLQGIEIKNDKKFRNTGNLFIETAEKRPEAIEYIPSGIFRDDNTWLYIIGDYDTFYILSKRWLQKTYYSEQFHVHTDSTKQGMLYPVDVAEKYYIQKYQAE